MPVNNKFHGFSYYVNAETEADKRKEYRKIGGCQKCGGAPVIPYNNSLRSCLQCGNLVPIGRRRAT
ncbi:MAG: hypothetical protein KAR06_06510 [Deltaproteobacteria bacterium]|nr:hypothetical protein [Deltaproteobacteria bacterium]